MPRERSVDQLHVVESTFLGTLFVIFGLAGLGVLVARYRSFLVPRNRSDGPAKEIFGVLLQTLIT